MSRLRWIGTGCGALFFLVLLSATVLMVVSNNRLRAKMAGAGHILTLEELARQSVPASQNAAVVYEDLLRITKSSVVMSSHRTLSDFLDASRRMSNPKLWDDARRVVYADPRIIPLVEQAAARPRCLFPIKWQDGLSAAFPHRMPMRQIGRILAAKAIIDAHDGKMYQSLRSIELLLKMSDQTKDEPILTTQMVRYSMVRSAVESLREAMSCGDLTQAQAKRLYDILGTIDVVPDYVRAMEVERAMGLDLYRQIERDPRGLTAISCASPSTKDNLLSYAWRPIASLDRSAYLDYMAKLVNASRYPYHVAEARRLLPDENAIPRYALVARVMSPVFARAADYRDCTQSEIYGSRLALALHMYKLRFGSYPASLTELHAGLGVDVPKDRVTGKDFTYKRIGKGYLLYGVGMNRRDEGGRCEKKPYPRRPDDIAWRAE